MSSRRVAIVAYHALEDGPSPVCVPVERFERQVRSFYDAGYEALTLCDVAAHIRDRRPFPARAVAFTFDDGYRSVHTVALPLLSSLGLRGTVFPVTAHLGGFNAWDAGSPRYRQLTLLDRAHVTELADAGWEIGAHTHTHRSLTELAPTAIVDEFQRSNDILQALSGSPVRTFAYPYGQYTESAAALAALWYDASVTIGACTASLRSRLDRLERIDAHYLCGDRLVRRLGSHTAGGYLLARRAGRALASHKRPARRARG